MKKISIIIPTFNRKEYLKQCLDSILNQTYKNIEIIMCDDCSKDNTLKIAQKIAKNDKRIILLKNKENLKSGMTRNKCLEKATGDYIAIQDADDYSDLKRIEKQVEFLENNQEYDFVSSGVYKVDESNVWDEYYSWTEKPINKDFFKGLPYVHAATMFRKDVLDKVKGYRVSKETNRTEDFDLFLRLHMNGYHGYNLKEPLYFYNENINAYMRKKYRYRIDEAKLRLNFYKKTGLMPQGFLYALKPLVVGLIPRKIQYRLKKGMNKKI